MATRPTSSRLAMIAAACLLLLAASPAHALLYDVDFGSPPHTVGLPPATGGGPPPRATVSSINFGTPTVRAALGALTDQPLEFDSFDGQGDQIEFLLSDLPPSSFYSLECDVLVVASTSSNFTITFDTPQIRNLNFTAAGTIAVFVPGVGSATIGSYTPGTIVHVRVDVDLGTDSWTIFLDGGLAHSGGFGGAAQVNDVRFTTPVISSPPGWDVGLDNLTIDDAPPVGDLYYDVDFGTPPHTVGLPPAIGGGPPPRRTVSSIPFGTPTVVATQGAMTDQPLRFDSQDLQGDQIRFTLSDLPPVNQYQLTCQLLIEFTQGSAFSVLFDTPQVRTINFMHGGTVTAFVPGIGSATIGSWTPGVILALRADIDLAADHWEIFLDGVSAHNGSFGGATQLDAVRISTPVTANPAAMVVGLDNLEIRASIPTTGIGAAAGRPAAARLQALAQPNPFRGQTVLNYALVQAAPVRLRIFDVSGRAIWQERRAAALAGGQRTVWDGRGTGGAPLPAGIYFLRVETLDARGGVQRAATTKLTLLP